MKRILSVIVILILSLILIGTLILRTKFVSERVRNYARIELERATRHRISIGELVLALFPPAIELKDVELLNNGVSIIKIKRARGYIGLGHPLYKEIGIRIKVAEPYFIIERNEDETFNLSPLIGAIQRYLKEEKKGPVKLDLKWLSIEDGEIKLLDKLESFSIHGKGISLDLRRSLLQKGFRISTKVNEIRLKQDLRLKAEAKVRAEEGLLKIEELKITSLGSSIGVEGDINLSERPVLDLGTKITLLARSFKELLGLKGEPTGEILISGKIKGRIPALKSHEFPELDLAMKAEVPVELLKEIMKRKEDVKGIIRAKGELKGKYPELKVRGEMSLEKGEISGVSVKKAEISFSSKDSLLRIERGNVYTTYSSAGLSGYLSLKTLQSEMPFHIHTDNLAEWVDPHWKGTKGIIDIKGTIKGDMKKPSIEGKAEIVSADVKGVTIQKGYGDVGYKNSEIYVSGFHLEQESSLYILDGRVRLNQRGPYYEATVKIKDGNPRKVVHIFYKDLPIETSVNGELTFRGGHEDYEGLGLITLEKGRAYGQNFDKARIKATLKRVQGRKGEIIFPSIEIERGREILNAEGRIGFGEGWSGIVSSKGISLEGVDLIRKTGLPIKGYTSMTIKGEGTFKRPEVAANLKIERLFYREGLLGEGRVSISLKGDRLHTSARLGSLRLDGEMALRDDLPWNADLFVKDIRLDNFLTQSGDITDSGKVSAITTGSIKGEGNGTDPERLFLNARLSSISLDIFGYKFHNDGEGVLSLKGRDLKVHSLLFKGPEGLALEIGGDMRLKGFYNLYIYGKADLGLLRAFIPNLETLTGDSEFMVALLDRWEAPEIQGTIDFKGGSLKIKDFPYRIGKLSGTISFEKDRVILDSLQGELGGGRIDLTGFATLKGFSMKNFYLEGKAHGVRYRYLEGLTATFDGTLSYEGDRKTQRLNGDIRFRKAEYMRRIDWKSWLLEIRKIEEKPKVEPLPLHNTNLNIHITGELWVDNNVGKGTVGLDLLLRGTPIKPLLFGRIESTEGRLFFRNNTFRILSATADFFDPDRIYPILNVIADTELKGYRIHLLLSGPIERFSLGLSSDPPLSEADILALLTVGQPVGRLQGLEAGVGASEAASFITGRLQDVLEERFRKIGGFDRFQVDPYVTRSSIAGGPRLTVGKNLLNGKLYITYSANIGTSEEQVLRLEYTLAKNVSLIGVRDEQGQLGGDLKFRFEFR